MSAAWSTAARFLTNAETGADITVRENSSDRMTGRLVGVGIEDGQTILLIHGFNYTAAGGLTPVARYYPMRLNERVGVDTLTASRIAARLKQTAAAEKKEGQP